MQITQENFMISVGCPNCEKLYQIPATALGDKGRTMKCKSCGEKWFCTTEHIQSPYESETPVLNTPKNTLEKINDPWESSQVENDDNRNDLADAFSEAHQRALSLTKEEDIENPFEISSLSKKSGVGANLKSIKFDKNNYSNQLSEDIQTHAEPLLAAQRAKRKRNLKLILFKPNVIAAALAMLVMTIFFMFPSYFVGINPSYANLYDHFGYTINTQGLAIDNLATRIEQDKAGTFLKIEGDITNITDDVKTVPRIKLFVKNKDGGEIYSWVFSVTKPMLLAGETYRFRTNYAEPSLEANEIEVKFLTSITARK